MAKQTTAKKKATAKKKSTAKPTAKTLSATAVTGQEASGPEQWCRWADLTVRQSLQRSKTGTRLAEDGLFANVDLPKGTKIPYLGEVIASEKLLERAKADSATHIVCIKDTHDHGIFIDAHPDIKPVDLVIEGRNVRIGSRGRAIAGKANCPTWHAAANDSVRMVRSRPNVNLVVSIATGKAHLLLKTALRMGTEILLGYGSGYKRVW
jgi:hypothetical protein